MIKTTICVMDTTRDKLKELKVHPNQSYEEVILELINDRGDKVGT